MGVGPFLGLAEAVLAFDLDVVETVFEGKTQDLGALRLGRPVGNQRQLDTYQPSSAIHIVRSVAEISLGLLAMTKPRISMNNIPLPKNTNIDSGERRE
jgi:hypothetical protein